MSNLSAGKIQVDSLNVAGLGAGSIKARNLNFNNLDVSGNLTVQGAQVATQAFVSSAVSSVIGSAGAALDTLGEIQAALGNDANLASTLTNSIATKANATDVATSLALKANASDVTTSLDLKAPLVDPVFTSNVTISGTILGDLNVQGNVITQNLNHPTINAFSDWEGIWTKGANSDWADTYAIVKQPNNTYTIYSLNNAGGSGLNSYDRIKKFKVLLSNVRPTLTFDISGNITENSLSITGTDNTVYKFHKKVRTIDATNDWAISFSGTGASLGFIYRSLKPSDFGSVQTSSLDYNWYNIYLQTVFKESIENKGKLAIHEDLNGVWDMVKDNSFRGYSLPSYIKSIILGKKYRVNKYNNIFEIANLHEHIKRNDNTYSFNVTNLKYATLAKDNILVAKYDFPYANRITPITPFSEIQFSQAIGNIPAGFKFLTSFLERPGRKINYVNCQSASANKNYIGVRLPLQVTDSSGAFSNTIPITFDAPGYATTTVNLPSGFYYPHDLASKLTELLTNAGTDMRVDFYTSSINWKLTSSNVNDPIVSYFYVTVDSSVSTLNVSCSTKPSLLSNVLGFGTGMSLTTNPSALTITTTQDVTDAWNVAVGGDFPAYRFNGTTINPDNLWTPPGNGFSSPTTPSNLTISTRMGSILTSGNPRDFFNARWYFGLLCDTEQHTISLITALQDIDQELYIPNNWSEYIYKFDQNNAKTININDWTYDILNDNCIAPGVVCKELQPYKNGNLGFWDYQQYAYNGAVSLSKVLKSDDYTKFINYTGSYTFNNYLVHDSLKTLVTDKTSGAVSMVGYYDSSSSFVNKQIIAASGMCFGLFKQSVVNKLIPDASGLVCGYIHYQTFIGFPSSSLGQNLIHQYFKDNNVAYIVYDVRSNLGGLSGAGMIQYGSSTYKRDMNSFELSHTTYISSATEPANITCEVYTDSRKNPSHWPSSISNILSTYRSFDWSQFDITDNPFDLRYNLTRSGSIPILNSTTLASNGNSGKLGVNLLVNSSSASACMNIWKMMHYNGITYDAMGEGVSVSLYGTVCDTWSANTLGALENRNQMVESPDIGILDHSEGFADNSFINTLHSMSPTGEDYASRFGPWYQADAISDHNNDTFLVEIGVGYTGSDRHPIAGTSIDHPETWRDFNLERALQVAHRRQVLNSNNAMEADYGYHLNSVSNPLKTNIFA
jgi:hypothetical protein